MTDPTSAAAPSTGNQGSSILNTWRAERETQRAMHTAQHSARGRELPGGRSTSRTPFTAASSDRLTASWLAGRQSINDELRSDLDRLRDRARDMARNNAYARKFLHMVARNVVGPNGFILQARVQDAPERPDTLANAAIEAAFYRWSRRGSAEITGRMGFADACRTIVRGVARDGEALVRIVRGADAGNAEGIALQLIDVARLDTQRNRAPAEGRNAIIMGVEVDDYQRPRAYWVKTRPDASSTSALRYPADDILHIYAPDMAEQVRGIPWMHAAMLDLHDLGEFSRSALLAARKGADTLGIIVSPDGTAQNLGDTDEDGTPIQMTAPGTFDVLPEGYDIREFKSQFPNETFEPFTKAILRRVSSGFDVAYNALANDLEGVNFSSIRAGVLEERDEWMVIQAWFIEALLEPVYAAWYASAMLAGSIRMPNGSALPVAKKDKFFAHEWQGRRWSWVDPMKDIESARKAIQTGITSPQIVAAQNGLDVEDTIASIAAFEALVAAKGVKSVRLTDGSGSPAPAPAPVPPDEENGTALS